MLGNSISQLRNYDTMKFYRATCGCMSDNHDRTILVELDRYDGITCSIYADVNYYHFCKDREANIFSRAWNRVVGAAKFLFCQEVKFEADFIFNDEDAASDYANAILGAVNELKQRRALSSVQSPAGND